MQSMPPVRVEMVPLRLLNLDPSCQARPTSEAEAAVEDYAELYRQGKRLNASGDVAAVFDGTSYWVYDGFQRTRAAVLAELDAIHVSVVTGTLGLARWLAAAANAKHGQPRSAETKRNAVRIALSEYPQSSDVALADHCQVCRRLVADVRRTLQQEVQQVTTSDDAISTPTPTSTVRVGRNGRTMTVGNIGKSGNRSDSGSDSETRGKPDSKPSSKPRQAPPVSTVDALGQAVPEGLQDVFVDRALPDAISAVRSWLDALSYDSHLRRLASRLAALPYLKLSAVADHLRLAHESLELAVCLLEAARPHAVCPTCAGSGCPDCLPDGPQSASDEVGHGPGYVTRSRLEELSVSGGQDHACASA